jgi:hypothetical protein
LIRQFAQGEQVGMLIEIKTIFERQTLGLGDFIPDLV